MSKNPDGVILLNDSVFGLLVLKKTVDGSDFILVTHGSVTTTFTKEEFLQYLDRLNSVRGLVNV